MDLRQECAASQDAPLPVPQAFVVRIDFTQFSRTNAPPVFSGGRSIRVSPKPVKSPPKRPTIRKCIA
jgi:hypothetical protein